MIRHQFLLLPAVLLCVVAMAISCANQRSWLIQQQGSTSAQPLQIKLNFFRDDELLALREESTQLTATLEYMVWQGEQNRLRQQLLGNLQQQINRSPMDGVLWQNLLYLQFLLPDQHAQIGWSLRTTLRLMQWRIRSFLPLAHHCIYLKEYLSESEVSQCNFLLANSIDRYPRGSIQRDLGISPAQLLQLQLDARGTL